MCVAQARARLRVYEEEEAERDGSDNDEGPMPYPEEPRERWDCESVLTTLSNVDNHPGKISEPARPSGKGGFIR